ncbi:MAG: branched-chain amino acid ABC transporter permease [Eubacteriales bacterium]|nr:branched-chain amino acid ABC transporter permease [Eubacteriales bacterium]
MVELALNIQLTLNGIMKGGRYGLLAIGLTIIYGVCRILYFAHGEFVMLAMYAGYFSYAILNLHPYLAIVYIVPLFFALGLLMYRLMFKRLVHQGTTAQIFTTVGLSIVVQNLALLLLKSDPRYVSMGAFNRILKIPMLGTVIRISLLDVIGFCIAIVLMLALFLFLQYSFKGRCLRAIIDQRRGASLCGLDVDAMYKLAIALGFACIGAAGAVLCTGYATTPTAGNTWKSIAFVAVILGGYNSIPGAVVAAILIAVVESFTGYYVSVHLKEVAFYVLFLVVLIVRPQGLFGRKSMRVGR